MEKFLQEVGARVKEARMRKHLSQAQLADLLGLTPPYISNIETGKQNMSITALAKISDVLEVSADWLLRNNTADALATLMPSMKWRMAKGRRSPTATCRPRLT